LRILSFLKNQLSCIRRKKLAKLSYLINRTQVTKDIHTLLEWKSCELIEMNIQIDLIHLTISVPPKISISQLMGILKGKTAIKVFKSYPQLKKKPYWSNHFWARGYCVDTNGLDEDKSKKYVQYQEKQERVEEQQKFDFGPLWGLFKSTFLEGGYFNPPFALRNLAHQNTFKHRSIVEESKA